jgi:hypothetical protein
MMAITFTKALVALLPFAFATAVPTRRDGTTLYRIHPVANSTLCLGSDFPSDGQPVILLECDEYTPGFTDVWSIEQGDNLGIIIGGNSPYCLDAGSTPGNNGLVHTWTCSSGLQQQQCVPCSPGVARPNLLTDVHTTAGTTLPTSTSQSLGATSALTREALMAPMAFPRLIKCRHTK